MGLSHDLTGSYAASDVIFGVSLLALAGPDAAAARKRGRGKRRAQACGGNAGTGQIKERRSRPSFLEWYRASSARETRLSISSVSSMRVMPMLKETPSSLSSGCSRTAASALQQGTALFRVSVDQAEELIAAPARHHAVFARIFAGQPGRQHQHAVTGQVPVPVVDLFEEVHVEQKGVAGPLPVAGGLHLPADDVAQRAPGWAGRSVCP